MNKVLLLGDSGVGKTTYLTKLKEGNFVKTFRPSKTVNIFNIENTIYMEIPGSGKFNNWDSYDFSDIQKVLILADKGSKISLKNAFQYWLPYCKIKCPDVTDIIILINKDDIENNQVFTDLLYELNTKNIKTKNISVKNEYFFYN